MVAFSKHISLSVPRSAPAPESPSRTHILSRARALTRSLPYLLPEQLVTADEVQALNLQAFNGVFPQQRQGQRLTSEHD
eukprot:319842-Pleurochrysis_carterae.AAC.1